MDIDLLPRDVAQPHGKRFCSQCLLGFGDDFEVTMGDEIHVPKFSHILGQQVSKAKKLSTAKKYQLAFEFETRPNTMPELTPEVILTFQG